MDKEKQLLKAVLESAQDGQEPEGRKRLACATAFKLAKEFEASIIEIGRLCDNNNIKICKCQLGCFS